MVYEAKQLEWNIDAAAVAVANLLKGLQDLLPLTEVPEQKVEGSGHQRGIVMHG